MATAGEVMHRGVRCIGENESLADAARMMRDLDVGSLPICGEDDRLKGMITDRDIVVKCCADGRDPADVLAADLAQGTPHWVGSAADLAEVLSMMETHQVRRVPVIEEQRLVGTISESDLARNLTDDQMARFVEHVYAVS